MDHEFHHHLSISLWNNEHGGNFTYDGADRVTHISSNGSSSSMRYDAHGALYYQQDVLQENNQSVTYTKHMVGGFEKKTRSGGAGSLTEYRYTVADDVVIVQRQSGSNHSEATYFLFKDHLGSVFTTLASTGEIISQQLFSAFGQTRTIYTASGVALGSMLPPTEQGFTGHRQMDALGIVHMKGRIYDPTLGRFLQADPFVQEPKNSQNYNRYSYVLNNPMSYTDPSGYFFKAIFKGIAKYWRVIAAAVVTYVTAGAASGWAASWGYAAGTVGNAAIAGAIAGAAGGFVATGSLKGAMAGAFSGAIFGAIGASFDAESGFWATNGAGHVGSHALTGGIISELQGGKFGHGFFSAGLTKAVNINGLIDSAGSAYDAARIAVAAVTGGSISAITGGKFGNGAVTAGFAQMLNGNNQIKGAKNNPIGHKTQGSIPIQGIDGKWYWADPQVHAKNFGSDYLARQTGTNMSDYIETTKEEAATALGYLGTGLATLGTGGTVFAGWLILGSAAVLDPSLQNIIGATTGPLGKAMRPVDDFFFPGATPLQQTIENVGHLNTAVTVACDIPFKC